MHANGSKQMNPNPIQSQANKSKWNEALNERNGSGRIVQVHMVISGTHHSDSFWVVGFLCWSVEAAMAVCIYSSFDFNGIYYLIPTKIHNIQLNPMINTNIMFVGSLRDFCFLCFISKISISKPGFSIEIRRKAVGNVPFLETWSNCKHSNQSIFQRNSIHYSRDQWNLT